jgi:hypothetical protein
MQGTAVGVAGSQVLFLPGSLNMTMQSIVVRFAGQCKDCGKWTQLVWQPGRCMPGVGQDVDCMMLHPGMLLFLSAEMEQGHRTAFWDPGHCSKTKWGSPE